MTCHRDHRQSSSGGGMLLSWPCALGMSLEAKKALIRARRNRFPENFEREAEVHQRSAEMITS